MSGIELWSTTAASNNSAPPNGAPEGMLPSAVNNVIRQVMASVRLWYEAADYLNLGHTPTYINGTSFSVTGDKTATYVEGRRILLTGTTPFTVYGFITSAVYSSVTTVTIVPDSGTLDNTLATVSIGILTPRAVNMVDNILQRPILTDYAEAKADITAASTTVLDLTTANTFNMEQAANISTFTWSNPSPTGNTCSFTLIRKKDNSGTSRTISWPAAVKWAGGSAPALTQTANAVDIFTFFTVDAGTTWYGFLAGGAMA